MSAPKRDSDGNLLRGRNPKPGGIESQADPQREVTAGEYKDKYGHELYDCLRELMESDGGYLKVRRELDGPELHFTWTYTVGPWSGYYVYARVYFWEFYHGFDLLLHKMTQVKDGSFVPTRDKYHEGWK